MFCIQECHIKMYLNGMSYIHKNGGYAFGIRFA